jgi:hypothetical protein
MCRYFVLNAVEVLVKIVQVQSYLNVMCKAYQIVRFRTKTITTLLSTRILKYHLMAKDTAKAICGTIIKI